MNRREQAIFLFQVLRNYYIILSYFHDRINHILSSLCVKNTTFFSLFNLSTQPTTTTPPPPPPRLADFCRATPAHPPPPPCRTVDRGSGRRKGSMAGVRRPSRRQVRQPHGRRAGVGGGDGVPGAVHGDVQERAAGRLGGAVQGQEHPVLRQPDSFG